MKVEAILAFLDRQNGEIPVTNFTTTPSLVTDDGFAISAVAEERCAGVSLERNHPVHLKNSIGIDGSYERKGGDLFPGETFGPVSVNGKPAMIKTVLAE